MSRINNTKKEALLPFFLSVTLFVAICLTSFSMFTYYDHKRWLVLLFLSIFSVVSVFKTSSPIFVPIDLRSIGLSLFIFFAYALIRGLFGFNINTTLDSMLWSLLIIFGYLLVKSKSMINIRRFLFAVIIPFSFYYILVLMQYVFVLFSPIDWSIQVLAVGFDNVRFINQCQALLFPIFIFFIFDENKPIRVSSYLSTIFTIAFALYSNGRGLMLVLIFETLILFIFFAFSQHKSIKMIFHLILIWLIGAVVYYVLWELIPSLIWNELSVSELVRSVGARPIIWREALLIWREYPLFGIGGMAYSDPSNGFTYNLGHPHNSIIQVLLEYGLVGFMLVLLFSMLFFTRAINHLINFEFQKHYPFTLLALIGGSALSLVSGVIVMPLSQFLWVLMFCVVYIELSSNLKVYNSKLKFSLSVGFQRASVLMLIFFLLLFSFFSYQYIMGQDALIMDAGPRFWLVGRFIY